jgi:cytochrome c553
MWFFLYSFLVWPQFCSKRIPKNFEVAAGYARSLENFVFLKFQESMGVREMRKSILAWFCGVAGVMVASACFAAEGGNAANGQTIFSSGKGDAAACMTCHGDKGQGNDAMGAPRLAGQGTAYIIKQLTDFAEGKRTPTGVGAVMPSFAKALSEQDRRDVAAYVHSINDAPELSDLKALKDSGQKIGEAYKGQILVQYGVMEKDHPAGAVPACKSCHQWNGRGAAPVFPMIGEQKYVYLVNQLHNWRANKEDVASGVVARTNDPVEDGVGMMRAVAKNLTDDDIVNVATFLSHAPETTMGNHRVPSQD